MDRARVVTMALDAAMDAEITPATPDTATLAHAASAARGASTAGIAAKGAIGTRAATEGAIETRGADLVSGRRNGDPRATVR